MPELSKHHPVRYSAQQMYDLVADVEAYPHFLPLCEALTVRTRREKAGREILSADMTVGYKAIRETSTSQVILNPADLAIDVTYLDGPFRHLDNRWRFHDRDGNGSIVEFYINYEFKSRMLGALMGGMFEAAFKRFTQAFETRAEEIHGIPAANNNKPVWKKSPERGDDVPG